MRLSAVPTMPFALFRETVVASGGQLLALFVHDDLYAVLGDPAEHRVHWLRTPVSGSYPSLTPDLPAASMFEREIFEETGIRPEGHPWLKPVRGRLEDFYRVEGDEVHEVAVGPVHAGVIEPGHFRFQCHGEEVLHLEIALGYQHRGVEALLVRKFSPPLLETIAGDTSVGHAIAGCQALEALAGCTVPGDALVVRAAALELERLANHCGDLGALAGDVGYLPTMSHCGRLRGDYLGLTASLCGSRVGRGIVRPGGVLCGLPSLQMQPYRRDVKSAVDLLWASSSVRARFEDTGRVSAEDARAVGLVGPCLRACGVALDARRDYPWFDGSWTPAVWPTGDVEARARVRWQEMEASFAFLEGLGPVPAARAALGPLAPSSAAVGIVEGWRGMIVHVVLTDAAGHVVRWKVVDPSFRNWTGLSLALRGTPISDFPLCNKSFNLSYCGFDL